MKSTTPVQVTEGGTTKYASGMLAPVDRRKILQVQGAKVGHKVLKSEPASVLVGTGSSNNMKLHNHHHRPDRTNTGQHNNQCNMCKG